jgi:hypothetical protein
MRHIKSFFLRQLRKDTDLVLLDFPVTGYNVLSVNVALEEQKCRAWHTCQYAPIRLGDLVDFR